MKTVREIKTVKSQGKRKTRKNIKKRQKKMIQASKQAIHKIIKRD